MKTNNVEINNIEDLTKPKLCVDCKYYVLTTENDTLCNYPKYRTTIIDPVTGVTRTELPYCSEQRKVNGSKILTKIFTIKCVDGRYFQKS